MTMTDNDNIRVTMTYGEFKRLLMHVNNAPEELRNTLRPILQRKLDQLSNRADYSAYKTSTDPRKREESRNRYLDRKGIPDSFRYKEPPV